MQTGKTSINSFSPTHTSEVQNDFHQHVHVHIIGIGILGLPCRMQTCKVQESCTTHRVYGKVCQHLGINKHTQPILQTGMVLGMDITRTHTQAIQCTVKGAGTCGQHTAPAPPLYTMNKIQTARSWIGGSGCVNFFHGRRVCMGKEEGRAALS